MCIMCIGSKKVQPNKRLVILPPAFLIKLPICFKLAFFHIKKLNLPNSARKLCNVKKKRFRCLMLIQPKQIS